MNSFPFHSEQSTTGIRLVQPMSDYMWSVQAALFIKTSFKQHVRLIFSSFPLHAASSMQCVCVCVSVCVCARACVRVSITCITRHRHTTYIYIYIYMQSQSLLSAKKAQIFLFTCTCTHMHAQVHTPTSAQICTNQFPSRLLDILIPINNK